ncbi:MAG: threonine synthase [Alphaproteobacteria bacterium]|nr:threonine synthase [Alphaproteobacteria bacterium]
MRYISTRGEAPAVSFLDAILRGLAPDGGLYVPESWPSLRPYLRENRGAMGHAGAAAEALYLFAEDDLSFAGAAALANEAYGPESRFAHPAIAPLKQLDGRTWLMELFHGPSLAFKDVAMQLIGALYTEALARSGARLTVVCATSGDTGGAAVEALKGSESVDLFVMLPKGRVSEVQRRFMTASGAANVHPILIDGDFDDCQAILKALFADRAFAESASLSGVNSISWARIVAQAAYFITASYALGGDGPVNFVVPTGNFGDAFAGYVAKKMGAPVGRILLATNTNDILARTIAAGRYARAAHSNATISPAMDIQVASNFERLVFECTGRDPDRTRALYAAFAQSGGFEVPAPALDAMRETFSAVAISDDETRAAMKAVHASTGELLCPHSAIAAAAAMKGADGWNPDGPVVLLATAHPAKFPDTVEVATGVAPPLPAHCATLYDRPERADSLPNDAEAVKRYVRERTRAWR